MLRARRRGVFKRDSLSGTGYRIERDGRKRFVLHGPDGQVAIAERQTGREWTVRAATGNLTLVKPSA
jgi:hypothetical protein